MHHPRIVYIVNYKITSIQRYEQQNREKHFRPKIRELEIGGTPASQTNLQNNN